MKYYLIFLVLSLAVVRSANAQILTPDFRYYSSCPTGPSEVNKCRGWVQPTLGTSDYFNVCADSARVGVPKNLFGYQTATINAYAGLFTYAPQSVDDYKEYIGTDFPPLTIGQTYTMTITVSLADSSKYATDGLGVFFTTYPVSANQFSTLLDTPQIDYSDFGVITDKVNWITLSKSFVADSAYTHLVLGCFKPNSTLKIDTLGGSREGAYYYIGQIGEPDSTRHSPTDFVTPPTPGDTLKPASDTLKPAADTPLFYAFPNAFTPNNDALNDVFRIISSPGIVFGGYVLSIYNRWGERVFITRDPANGWDGTINGTPQDMNVFFYFSEFTVNGKHERLKGNITLIR